MSVGTDFKRILRTGFVNFTRNPVISIASILIMTITLCLIGFLILMNAVLSFSLAELNERVDVNVYFYPDTEVEDIKTLQEKLEQMPEVTSVEYVSRDEAITEFKDRHENDYLTLQALKELENNPLGASLNIQAEDPSQYATIANYLESDADILGNANSVIEKVNYHRNEAIIKRLNNVTNTAQRLGVGITAFFIIISVLITFNTVRLAIYSSREEVAVMRLMGADKRYVRGPFMVEGLLYGLVSAAITIGLFFPITLWLSGFTASFFGGMDLFAYYVNNLPQIVVILIVVGMLLGVVSGFLAVRKYLNK